MTNNNGLILMETNDIVVIATGLRSSSSNSKTGGMIQIYILNRNESPLDAIRSGADATICGDCKHRATLVDGKLIRRCYVQVGKAPMSIWRCYARGGYANATHDEYESIFSDRIVRFGAYGDPAYMAPDVVKAIASACSAWTAYTHQWRRPEFQWLKNYAMASCDTPQEAEEARAMGWRYFRVATHGDSRKLHGEIGCPAAKENGSKSQCERCKLCSGTFSGDPRKSIVIQDHSVIAKSKPLFNIL